MSYAIDIPPALFKLMEGLPRRTCSALYGTLDRMGVLAELWGQDDKRWQLVARTDGKGFCFYADGCCVRVELHPEERRLEVREIGRVLVHLPAHGLNERRAVQGSHPEH